ncbi:MAG TPA: non-heme iron oxygenase ferredoxin subunit [Bacteroidia bacterium]|nr:non-heme iron oxygenase ferredoxin subunit [Bacteroidia bacterium]
MTFHPIARSEELEEGKGRPYQLEGHRLALVRHQGVVYALEDNCPHADASIAFGFVENGCIACPWHYAEFDLSTGAVLCGPATTGIPAYPVREESGTVYVSLNPIAPSGGA